MPYKIVATRIEPGRYVLTYGRCSKQLAGTAVRERGRWRITGRADLGAHVRFGALKAAWGDWARAHYDAPALPSSGSGARRLAAAMGVSAADADLRETVRGAFDVPQGVGTLLNQHLAERAWSRRELLDLTKDRLRKVARAHGAEVAGLETQEVLIDKILGADPADGVTAEERSMLLGEPGEPALLRA